ITCSSSKAPKAPGNPPSSAPSPAPTSSPNFPTSPPTTPPTSSKAIGSSKAVNSTPSAASPPPASNTSSPAPSTPTPPPPPTPSPRQRRSTPTTYAPHHSAPPAAPRRFWPVTTPTRDPVAATRDRNQLWAEAVSEFRAGTPWWPSPPHGPALAEAQNDRFDTDPWEPLVLDYIAPLPPRSSTQILHALLPLPPDPRKRPPPPPPPNTAGQARPPTPTRLPPTAPPGPAAAAPALAAGSLRNRPACQGGVSPTPGIPS